MINKESLAPSSFSWAPRLTSRLT